MIYCIGKDGTGLPLYPGAIRYPQPGNHSANPGA
jgi:hypothetical protein